MTESDKVSHVLKGIADDAFHLLICKDCVTVDSIVKECRRFEQAKGRRIARQFTRLPNTAATSSCEQVPVHPLEPATPEHLTKIVRREIEAMTPAAGPLYAPETSVPTISLIQAVVREEISNLGLPTICSVNRAPTMQIPPPISRQNEFVPPAYRSRRPSEWRTPDDKPICFNCCRAGHIARYCRSRWMSSPRPPFFDSRSTNIYPPFEDQRPRSSPRSQQDYDASSPRYSARSPSPQRRQSRSPQPRRPLSPTSYRRPTSEN